MNTMQGFWANSIRARAARRLAGTLMQPKQMQPKQVRHSLARPPQVAATLPPQKPQLRAQDMILASISQAGTMLLPVPVLQMMQPVTPPSPSFAEMHEAEVAATRGLVERAIRAFHTRYNWLPEEVLVGREQLLTIPGMHWEYFPVQLENIGCYTVFLRLEASMEMGEAVCVGLPGRHDWHRLYSVAVKQGQVTRKVGSLSLQGIAAESPQEWRAERPGNSLPVP